MVNQSELQRVEKDQIYEIESVLNHRKQKHFFFFFCMLNFINFLLVTNTSTGSELSLE